MLSNRSLRYFVACVVTLTAATIQAQNPERQDSTSASAKQAAEPDWATVLLTPITIDQSSGPLSLYIDNIRQNNPKLNIVVTESAAAHPLPDIKLADIPVRGSLSLLSTLTNNEIQVDFMSEEEGREANLVMIAGGRGAEVDTSTTVRVLNVKRLLQLANRESLLSALDEGYRMLENQGTPVEIKIHETTGLLFIKGTPAQLMLAESVVQEIEKGFSQPFDANPFGQSGASLPSRNESLPPVDSSDKPPTTELPKK